MKKEINILYSLQKIIIRITSGYLLQVELIYKMEIEKTNRARKRFIMLLNLCKYFLLAPIFNLMDIGGCEEH